MADSFSIRIQINRTLLSHYDKIFKTGYRSYPGFRVVMSNSSTRIYPDTWVLESKLNKYPDIRIYIFRVSEYSDSQKSGTSDSDTQNSDIRKSEKQ